MARSIVSPKTFLAYSLGCRTNQAEIESICSQLTAHSLRQARKKETPAIVILNTCVVTQKAEKETRQKIRELRKKYPKSFLVVLGCAVTANEKFKIDLPKADLNISNKNKNQSLKLILKYLNLTATPDKRHCYSNRVCRDLNLNKYQLSGRKFIKIQDGCDCVCSFCLTRYLRNKPKSVPPEKVIEEINFWVEKGIKEIILTGINIGLYGKDLLPILPDKNTCYSNRVCRELNIDYLLNKILSETKVERISLSSIYPEMLTDNFIKLIINNPRFSQYFHLSLQSGSQSVLERMNRKTNLIRLSPALKQIKAENKFFTFKADIITGFPNETEKEFQETLDFIKKAKISFVHHFLFSRRQHTKAEVMIKNKTWKEVPDEVKKQRAEMLNKIVKEIRKDEAKKMIDSLFHCLIVRKIDCHSERGRACLPAGRESLSHERRWKGTPPLLRRTSESVGMTTYEGITENGWPIIVQSHAYRQAGSKCKVQSLKGKILPMKVTGFKNDQLLGEIFSLPTNSLKTSGTTTDPSAC